MLFSPGILLIKTIVVGEETHFFLRSNILSTPLSLSLYLPVLFSLVNNNSLYN